MKSWTNTAFFVVMNWWYLSGENHNEQTIDVHVDEGPYWHPCGEPRQDGFQKAEVWDAGLSLVKGRVCADSCWEEREEYISNSQIEHADLSSRFPCLHPWNNQEHQQVEQKY